MGLLRTRWTTTNPVRPDAPIVLDEDNGAVEKGTGRRWNVERRGMPGFFDRLVATAAAEESVDEAYGRAGAGRSGGGPGRGGDGVGCSGGRAGPAGRSRHRRPRFRSARGRRGRRWLRHGRDAVREPGRAGGGGYRPGRAARAGSWPRACWVSRCGWPRHSWTGLGATTGRPSEPSATPWQPPAGTPGWPTPRLTLRPPLTSTLRRGTRCPTWSWRSQSQNPQRSWMGRWRSPP